MERMAGRPIFSLGEHVLTWDDVVLAAHLWSEMTALERAAARGIAAERRLAAGHREVDSDDVENAATAWRYDADLIAADDLDAWLAARALSSDEWLAYFRRRESAARVTQTRDKRPSPADVHAVLYAEAMCSGMVTRVTERLAGCVAVADRAREGGASAKIPATKMRSATDRLPATIERNGLHGLSAGECRRRAEVIARASVSSERFAKRVDGDLVRREVEANTLGWTRVRCKMLVFNSEGAAREAALLVREDGLSIAKAAAAANTRARAGDVVVDDAAPALRDRLVVAQAGDLIGPIETDEGFLVASVTERVAPAATDPAVRARATDRIVARTVQAEIDRRITWHERF